MKPNSNLFRAMAELSRTGIVYYIDNESGAIIPVSADEYVEGDGEGMNVQPTAMLAAIKSAQIQKRTN